jgi:iron complex transport system permease protein
VVCAVLLGIAVGVSLVALATGDFPVPVPDVIDALFGHASSQVHLVVIEWRLPRVLMALILGATLGMSGAIFQSLTRNPLGSPDIIGFNTGAYTGALVVIIILGNGYLGVAAGALIGGVATAAMVYLLAFKRGVQGFRLIIVGIAISAMLGSVNTFMILRASLDVALAAAVWGAGSLNGIGWSQAVPAGIAALIVAAIALVMSPSMQMLEMGDDAASALGIRAEKSRVTLMFLGVALTAMVTAAAGPIGFVSLAAPQIVRRITRTAGVCLLPSAVMGAVLLTVSDWLAQHAFPGIQLPVGVVTVSIGGVYFVWLLITEARKQ